MSAVSIQRIDLNDPAHVTALLDLLDEYAGGPTGRGEGLDAAARARLPGMLAQRPNYLGWVAFVGGQPAGLINCFEGVSTFRAQPLLNLHDIVVAPKFRRRGVATALIAAAEREAMARGCCKLTLEVLSGNHAAIHAYLKAGFAPYALDPELGRAQFFEKKFY
ncbi:MAG: GNAT family N-acetyltransferase [Burkholderiaceae bacterium]